MLPATNKSHGFGIRQAEFRMWLMKCQPLDWHFPSQNTSQFCEIDPILTDMAERISMIEHGP